MVTKKTRIQFGGGKKNVKISVCVSIEGQSGKNLIEESRIALNYVPRIAVMVSF